MDKHRHKWWALVGLSLLAFTAYLDFTIVNTALPYIQKALKTDILDLQWVSNVFPIILSMTMISVGKFGDLLGRKRVFYFGVAVFAIAALCAGFSPNVYVLILFRGLQALGASIVFITSSALLTDAFPPESRGKAISIYGGVTGLGLMVGPFFGGILIGLLDWRWVFWINLPIIAVGLIITLFSLRGVLHVKEYVRIDWKGLGLLIFGLGALMYGIVASHWVLLAAGAAALILLIILEKGNERPLLYLAIFKDPLILLSVFSCALAGIVSYVYMFFDPLYLENVRKLSPYEIGFLIAIIPAAQVVISFAFSSFVKWAGLANLLFYSTVAALLASALHWFIGAHTPLIYLALPFALLGINWGLSNTAMVSAANQNITPKKIGEAIGTVATIWNMSGSIFLAISTVIFQQMGPKFLPAFYSVIEFNSACMLLVLIAAIWIRKKLPAS